MAAGAGQSLVRSLVAVSNVLVLSAKVATAAGIRDGALKLPSVSSSAIAKLSAHLPRASSCHFNTHTPVALL